ncbi:aromatic-ring-hydroxylating dioxygenase subunit beta [Cryptosporangium phraense]|uniref:Aromatic-ring-hydroxylating dioxygenase subunit beta n=1 Tax=Cryptosporangium phraense TaxID=2593070 RepID=A0A545AQ90_9ACTN|nr:aromatic-ring-hydroxylating dioxygenase subunit beta [Cryptosporangium phraense]TQS43421.1 aromatic-ring-hydroxylating dioxygenase subunit beta [Cryptosporangium phraense]
MVDQRAVEKFLFTESDILDHWRLDEWLELFTPGARYEIPTTDWKGGSPADAGYFVCDDWDLIQARVKRLQSRKAHAERPRSRTHRLIGNVQFEHVDDSVIDVQANFVVHRMRDGLLDPYLGRYEHRLNVTPDGLRFALRRSILVQESLNPGGRLSFIL